MNVQVFPEEIGFLELIEEHGRTGIAKIGCKSLCMRPIGSCKRDRDVVIELFAVPLLASVKYGI